MKFGKIKNIKGNVYFRCKVTGNSMLPLIKNNDIIKFKTKFYLEEGDIIIYKSFNGNIVCHRVINIGRYILTKGDNCRYNDIKIKRNDIIGKVINTRYQRYKKLLTILSKMDIIRLYNKGMILWKRKNWNGKHQTLQKSQNLMFMKM